MSVCFGKVREGDDLHARGSGLEVLKETYTIRANRESGQREVLKETYTIRANRESGSPTLFQLPNFSDVGVGDDV